MARNFELERQKLAIRTLRLANRARTLMREADKIAIAARKQRAAEHVATGSYSGGWVLLEDDAAATFLAHATTTLVRTARDNGCEGL